MEAAPGFEPGNKGFADLCLTTWLCRRVSSDSGFLTVLNQGATGGFFWSGKRGLNPRPPPWQGGALPLSYSRVIFLFFFGAGADSGSSISVKSSFYRFRHESQDIVRGMHVRRPCAGSGYHTCFVHLEDFQMNTFPLHPFRTLEQNRDVVPADSFQETGFCVSFRFYKNFQLSVQKPAVKKHTLFPAQFSQFSGSFVYQFRSNRVRKF